MPLFAVPGLGKTTEVISFSAWDGFFFFVLEEGVRFRQRKKAPSKPPFPEFSTHTNARMMSQCVYTVCLKATVQQNLKNKDIERVQVCVCIVTF